MLVALRNNPSTEGIIYIILGRCSLSETWDRPWFKVAIPPETNLCFESPDISVLCPDFETKEFEIVCNYGKKFLIVERPTDTKYLPGFDDRTDSQICFDNLVKERKK